MIGSVGDMFDKDKADRDTTGIVLDLFLFS